MAVLSGDFSGSLRSFPNELEQEGAIPFFQKAE